MATLRVQPCALSGAAHAAGRSSSTCRLAPASSKSQRVALHGSQRSAAANSLGVSRSAFAVSFRLHFAVCVRAGWQ
eukprot:4366845-Pyramimonas_sp.AAC.1